MECAMKLSLKIVSEYDQEITQSQTADNPVAPWGKAAQPSLDTKKTNQEKQPALSSPSRSRSFTQQLVLSDCVFYVI